MGDFLKTAGAAIEAIRINRITRETRDGREVWVKQRRRWSGLVIRCANLFFGLVGQPVCVRVSSRDWQQWETECFTLLHGEKFCAFAEEPRKVCAERLPGKSIASHFVEGSFSEEMLDAAAAELRRAHALTCAEFDGPWSHGDANLANFLFDETECRARMIDFELVHHRSLPAELRQADDLLVFLQDLCGCISPDRWLPAAAHFLEAYGNGPVIGALKMRLQVPHGLPLVWWIIRANYVPPAELRRRFDALREALG
jgi:hypothetical protein